MAYGARLESVLGESPRGFESPILRTISIHDVLPLVLGGAMVIKGAPDGTLLRPVGRVVRQGAVASIVFLTPVFTVLYFLTGASGLWFVVFSAQVLASALVALVILAYRRASIRVDSSGITERGFFGTTTHFPVERIGSIIAAETFDAGSETTIPQLFVCDHQGRQLVRMRGQYWSKESMDVVTTTLPVPVTKVEDSLSTRELGTDYPGLLYWFERHPVGAALVLAVVVGAGGYGFFFGMKLAGLPV